MKTQPFLICSKCGLYETNEGLQGKSCKRVKCSGHYQLRIALGDWKVCQTNCVRV